MSLSQTGVPPVFYPTVSSSRNERIFPQRFVLQSSFVTESTNVLFTPWLRRNPSLRQIEAFACNSPGTVNWSKSGGRNWLARDGLMPDSQLAVQTAWCSFSLASMSQIGQVKKITTKCLPAGDNFNPLNNETRNPVNI